MPRTELFTYTSGRFLVNEEGQFSKRYRELNIDALCDVAASTSSSNGGISRITAIEKLEGGFSKALLMRKENGEEVIAKIPYRIAGPAVLTTAAEVGVSEYLRKYTTIPVPRVLNWSSDISNPVEAEYILMEKANGVQLYDRWGEMAEIEKMELIKHLTQLEAQSSATSFPAYGGLYLRDDASRLKHQDIDDDVDKDNLFYVGPSPEASFYELDAADGVVGEDGQTPESHSLICRGRNEEQASLLEATIALMRMLDSHPILSQFSQPTLWHTDLMGNIFITPDDNSRITSLIDIQSLSIRPLFLQTRWPEFLQPPREYPQGFIQPTLPENFDDLDQEDKPFTLNQWDLSKMARAYELSTFLENRPVYNAMNVPRVFRELFSASKRYLPSGSYRYESV
ncbi:aminoglycoside phosphotransferase family protein [Aspergillus affinis]|uniref:aminoglycoside phosphotransferase family protein n=1 Tax=Aspergillus affinis TaxID=1070780 RepID=UPI0022FE8588|nr:uncharacterized protein KD926_004890 [Aspergillus affinis]KAI9042825.1 hypothetical protein KD926_004890 [Aspergillus affinis]